jgi:hypothetical protein
LIKLSVQIDRLAIPQRETAGRQGVHAHALSKITSEQVVLTAIFRTSRIAADHPVGLHGIA